MKRQITDSISENLTDSDLESNSKISNCSIVLMFYENREISHRRIFFNAKEKPTNERKLIPRANRTREKENNTRNVRQC